MTPLHYAVTSPDCDASVLALYHKYRDHGIQIDGEESSILQIKNKVCIVYYVRSCSIHSTCTNI